MSDDLVERLREIIWQHPAWDWWREVPNRDGEAAANEIERLRAELAAERERTTKLRAALVETLAVATRNEEGDFADRARAALKETK